MGGLTRQQETYLAGKFGERVRFDRRERKIYSHDIAAMPKLVRPFLGNTLADAVVQPTTETELVDLVRWARTTGVPLTPRGKATSGYGGVLPARNGVVVDFYRLQDVLSVDRENMAVTVQPGISWKTLDRKLGHHGLTLRLYPTSYPSSTVGGWLAQGGAGIGSYQYGYFRDNVVAARVVLPTGEVREFFGEDLDLISGAEGITGLISSITLRVQAEEPLRVRALSLPSAGQLQEFIEALVDESVPIWSMIYTNPRMAELRNEAPVRTHQRHPVEKHVELPEAYILMVTSRESDATVVDEALKELGRASGATLLSQEIADHEWENRFNLMVVKRLGPSLVPAEVAVPLASLGDTMDEIEATVDQPIVKEGIIIRDGERGEPEAVILGFIPADERTLGYNFVFSLSLTVMKIARKHRGRPYATGLYFSKFADEILGRDRVRKLRSYKSQVDPKRIMNPGKVIDSRLIASLLQAAEKLEPVARPLANAVQLRIDANPSGPSKDVPDDVAWYSYVCSQCGFCVEGCTQFYGQGWESQSPRGKWYWLREYLEGREKWDQEVVDTFVACTTCEKCDLICSAKMPVEPSWMKLRGKLIDEDERMTFPPFEIMAASLQDNGDIWAGYRKDRSNWFPEDMWEKHGPDHQAKNVYFAGCTASYVEPDIARGAVRLMDDAGVDFTYLGEKENCCATPMLVAGKWDDFLATMKANIEAVKEAGGDTVITSCPACDLMWRQVYPEWAEKLGIEYNISTRNYTELVAEKLSSGEFSFPENDHEKVRVTWHDSCHIGRGSGIYEPPRDVIRAIPNAEFVEMEHNREEGLCCGSVLTLLKDPPAAADMGQIRLQEAVDIKAEKVLALCPCCQFQLRVSADKKNIPVEVTDLAHFAAEALGYELENPHPEVLKQWAVFEAMIALMTPEGFASLMGSMWPQLVDAMPLGMGKIMRLIGRLGPIGDAAFTLMKPMFPVLFPIMLPKMMPRVMPDMLKRVEERISMPDYMREQLPALMPRVMDNLMPHMIGDVVPLVTDPMIDYLRGRRDSVGPDVPQITHDERHDQAAGS